MTHPLAEALERRVLVLDGATGTMQQGYGLNEGDYRGERFAPATPLTSPATAMCYRLLVPM